MPIFDWPPFSVRAVGVIPHAEALAAPSVLAFFPRTWFPFGLLPPSPPPLFPSRVGFRTPPAALTASLVAMGVAPTPMFCLRRPRTPAPRPLGIIGDAFPRPSGDGGRRARCCCRWSPSPAFSLPGGSCWRSPLPCRGLRLNGEEDPPPSAALIAVAVATTATARCDSRAIC